MEPAQVRIKLAAWQYPAVLWGVLPVIQLLFEISRDWHSLQQYSLELGIPGKLRYKGIFLGVDIYLSILWFGSSRCTKKHATAIFEILIHVFFRIYCQNLLFTLVSCTAWSTLPMLTSNRTGLMADPIKENSTRKDRRVLRRGHVYTRHLTAAQRYRCSRAAVRSLED
ncbi:hypothetical protein UY3_16873 [Chelonia mydas]|uniref:Uncharacterized protein n=1 Tax=Chelonia mydas TaxID=8469 RepID=M7BCT9_CHEMY|nr:hypothetical protein UY3_16873 [Chelonia mydas]